MPKELWINLPVKNLKKSREFFTEIGFSIHERHLDSDEMVGLVMGTHKVMVMLFPEDVFTSFTNNELADTKQGTEVLLSLSLDSKEEIDNLIQKVRQAGGAVFAEPEDQNGMYGAGFSDLDGHRWNLVYM